MKKSLFVLGLATILATVAYGEETEKPWAFSARTYAEVESFSGDLGKDGAEDAAYFGVGVNATRGKFSYDLNVEKRGGGTTPFFTEGWEQTRVDYKVRYQALDNVGVHVKYRSETQAQKKKASEPYWQGSKNRDRLEFGTDWGGVLNTSGWFVVGFDTDTNTAAKEEKGWYWEGDFGPSYEINEKLTIRPTFFTTGENYDDADWTYREHQLRLMAIYRLNDKVTLMPRVRYSLVREVEDAYDAAGRYRIEFMGTTQWTEKASSFWGVAYDYQDRDFDASGEANKDFSMLWAYFSLAYSF